MDERKRKVIEKLKKNPNLDVEECDYDPNMTYHTLRDVVDEVKYFIDHGEWGLIEKLLKIGGEGWLEIAAAKALLDVTLKDGDITPAVPVLIHVFDSSHTDSIVRTYVVAALASYYINKENWEKFIGLLSDTDICTSLKRVKNKIRKISEVLVLVEVLKVENENIRKIAAQELVNAAEEGRDITLAVPALVNALSDEYRDVRMDAAEALNAFIEKCNSVEGLDRAQKALETSFTEWLKKQRQGPSPEKIRMKVQISQLLTAISNRKAELSKKDGELLLGETVKKPKDKDKKMYRSLRKIGC
jgi:hypothetical protein